MDKGYNPRPILYFACGKLTDYRELDEVLEYYKWKGIGSSVIILNEVTYLKNGTDIWMLMHQ